MQKDDDPPSCGFRQICFQPLALGAPVGKSAVQQLRVQHDEVEGSQGLGSVRRAEVVLPGLHVFVSNPTRGHGRVLLVADVHVACSDHHRQTGSADLVKGGTPAIGKRGMAGILLLQISHVEDQLGSERLHIGQSHVPSLDQSRVISGVTESPFELYMPGSTMWCVSATATNSRSQGGRAERSNLISRDSPRLPGSSPTWTSDSEDLPDASSARPRWGWRGRLAPT